MPTDQPPPMPTHPLIFHHPSIHPFHHSVQQNHPSIYSLICPSSHSLHQSSHPSANPLTHLFIQDTRVSAEKTFSPFINAPIHPSIRRRQVQSRACNNDVTQWGQETGNEQTIKTAATCTKIFSNQHLANAVMPMDYLWKSQTKKVCSNSLLLFKSRIHENSSLDIIFQRDACSTNVAMRKSTNNKLGSIWRRQYGHSLLGNSSLFLVHDLETP